MTLKVRSSYCLAVAGKRILNPGLLLSAALIGGWLYGCSLSRAVRYRFIEDLGRFEYREPAWGLEGVAIGAPHGRTERNSDRIARAISDRTGAGLVLAYGFKSKRLGVTQPIMTSRPYLASIQRGSVYREYRKVLLEATGGDLDVYVGIHRSANKEVADRIEVATSGLTFEEAAVLKDAYIQLRDKLTKGKQAPRVSMAIEPLDRISWRVSGVKHHGVLLVAGKGMNLRIPQFLTSEGSEELYTEVLAHWVHRAIELTRANLNQLPRIQVRLMDPMGRVESIPSRKGIKGVVIGAPHGSFDEFTAEVVKQVSYRTGIAAVIAKGFTPTEGGGWRINVNRPTEKMPYSEGRELHTQRARAVFSAFRDIVFKASAGKLELYVDIHQYNTGNKIQVATVGITKEQARIIKMLYHKIRDHMMEKQSPIPAVELWIEPLDTIEIGAWAAKAEGILALAKRSLHIELPSHRVLVPAKARETYIRILSALLRETVPFLQPVEKDQHFH